jgi:hypothetical protein
VLWCPMRLIDDSGRSLDGEYSVERDGDGLAVIMESRGGTGQGSSRNREYNAVLRVLLGRLKVRGAVLLEAVVDSRFTRRQGIPAEDRRLIDAPVVLAERTDIDALRREVMRRAGSIGQRPGARKAGTTSKRIRMSFEVPGYGPDDAARLETDLAAPLPPVLAIEDAGRLSVVDGQTRATALANITGLGLDTDETIDPQDDEQQALALLHALAAGSFALIDAETSHVTSTEYERKAATVTIRRGEAQLVARYRQTLPDDDGKRLRLPVGYTDLYRVRQADLIEAKVSAGHQYVRQALGQLLDYAAFCTHPLKQLTALFPRPPEPSDILLLHTYGIDCLYWAGGNEFRRLEAPEEARQRMAANWTSLASTP